MPWPLSWPFEFTLAFRFSGTDSDINIETHEPEFRAWKWADPDDLPGMAVPFKRTVYESVLTRIRESLNAE